MYNKDYSKVITEGKIKIGYVFGSDTVLFVKTGQGGSIYGYEGKYIDLALKIKEKYGYSVFISETNEDDVKTFEREIRLVKSNFVNNSCQIYYLGYSKGGLIGCWYAASEESVVGVVSVNAPLMMNYYSKTLPGIKMLSDKLTLVYGTRDPSYKYLPFAEKYADVHTIEGADHNLLGSDVGLIDIAEKYLLNK